MKKLVSALIIMTMILTSLTVPVSVSAADAAQESDNILLVEDFEGEGNAFASSVSNAAAFGGKTGNVGQIDLGTCTAELDIPDVYGGGVKVSYDVYLISGGNRPIMAVPAEGGESQEDYPLLQVFQTRVRTHDGDDAVALICKGTADAWHRVEQVINLDRGVVQTKIYTMDGVLIGSASNDVACDSIGAIQFKNWSAGSNFFIDDVQVELVDLTPVPGVIASEDFEGESNVFGSTCVNETFEGLKAGKVSQTSAVMDFDDIYSGTVKLSFDYYAKGVSGSNVNTQIIVNPACGDTTGADTPVLQLFQHRVRYATGDQANICAGDNGWRHIEQIFEIGSGVVKTYVYSLDKTTILGEGYEAISYASLGAITFKSISANMDFYMDNVSVEILDTTQKPGIITSEDFEGSTYKLTGDFTVEELEGKKAAKVVKGYSASIDFDDIAEGGAKLSYDVYAFGGSTNVNCEIYADSTVLMQVFQHKLRKVNGDTIYSSNNGWLHVEQYINLSTGLAKTWVYDMDNNYLTQATENVGCHAVGMLTFKSMGSNPFYVDNIQVEAYSLNPEPAVIATESFDGETSAFDEYCVLDTTTFAPEKVGKITKPDVSFMDIDDVHTGTVKIAFDAYAHAGTGANVNCTVKANPAEMGSGGAIKLVQVFQNRIRPVVDNSVDIYSGTGNGWLHLEVILNLEDGTVTTQVYDMNRKFLAKATETVGCYSIGGLTFQSDGSKEFYMDNLVVEKYIDRPEVTEIAVYDVFGNKVEDMASAAYAIEKVEIVFDEAIAKSNPSTYFTLAENGSQVNVSGKISDNVYTMTLKQKLEPGKTYTIAVSEKVENLEGNTTNQNYEAILATVNASDISSEVRITEFEKVESKINVKAVYVNAESGEIPMVFMVAFYDAEGIMLGVADPQVKDSSDVYGHISVTFDDYAGTGTVAETKLFYWDSLTGMNPYGGTEAL